jgi:hypothetical protein
MLRSTHSQIENLTRCLEVRRYDFPMLENQNIAYNIKEKLYFVSGDIQVDQRIASETTDYQIRYILRDA